jgi:tRNA U34 5-methylaminomethyl-2-thiouridine-forming methyltransferase MnmC
METLDDLSLHRTNDGSFTLRSSRLDEPYHSMRGALCESMHVFIRQGLLAHPGTSVDVLEVGLGTGLNMLLTWLQVIEGRREVRYVGLEPRPLERTLLAALRHPHQSGLPVLEAPFLDLMTGPEDTPMRTAVPFTFTRSRQRVEDLRVDESFDLVYHDAFGPRAQPEMWTEPVFRALYRMLRPGGMLVTYCSKGEVRRAMQRAGLHVERLEGPPGKREMLRAVRPVDI